jgi:hypothetical protein
LFDLHLGLAGDTRGPLGTQIGVPGNRFFRTAGPASGARVVEMQYSFDVTKQTRLFVIGARLMNDRNGSYNFQVPGDAAAPAGMHASVLSTGMYITF